MPQPPAGGQPLTDPYLELLPDLRRTYTPAELRTLIDGRFAIRRMGGGFGRILMDFAKDVLDEWAVTYTGKGS